MCMHNTIWSKNTTVLKWVVLAFISSLRTMNMRYAATMHIKRVWMGVMYNSNNFLHQQKCTKPLSLIKHDRRLKNNDFASIFNMFCSKFDLCSPFRKSKDDISYRTHCIKYINLLQARGQMVWSALIQNRGGNQAKRLQFFGCRNYYVNNS